MRTLLFIGMVGTVGLVAHRVARGEPEVIQGVVQRAPTIPPMATCAAVEPRLAAPVPAPPAAREPAAVAEGEDQPDEEGGEDLGVLMAGARERVAVIRRSHNAIVGRVTDARTGEVIAGTTIIATSPQLQGAQTAISDEHGDYEITGLPTGSYLVTFYYSDLTVERDGVMVSSFDPTPVFQKLDTAAMYQGPITVTMDSTSQGITIDKNYVVNLPVPGRTFESALGAAAGSQVDGLGVSFSGTTSLDNTYVVDDIDTTNLRFGDSE